MKNTKLIAGIAAALSLAAFAPTASAEAGQWFGHFRVGSIVPADKSDANSALDLPGDAIGVSNEWFPDISIGRYFTDNFALELLLTIPRKHDVEVDGVGKIGDFKHLPPTLFAQWHFNPAGKVNPYVGVGLNVTFIMDDNIDGPEGSKLSLDSTSIGPALQAGIDFAVTDQWSISVDIKKIWIDSDVKLGSTKITNVGVDPMLYSVGVGYRF